MKSPFPVLIAAALALTLPGLSSAETSANVPAKIVETKAALRDLWVGHIFWLRAVAEARLAGQADQAKVAEQQVVANAQALAGSIAPFYGKAASDQLFKLLAGHWSAISDYLDATRDGKSAGQDAAYKKLVDNAGEIATFLAGANPNLPAPTVRSLLTAHGAQHIEQIKQIKAGQYAQEAKTWAAMKAHVYMISDAIAGAIAKQFPEKFS